MGKKNFTWDDLQFFLAVARTGQLSTAARQLRTSHVTVSRRIDRLEFSMKVKLFERNPRGYMLTTMGQRFIETAEKIEQETDRLQDEIIGGAKASLGTVRLSAPEGFSNFFFTHKLPEFSVQHPNIAVELVTIQQIMALSRKEADVAVVLDPPKAGPYYTELLTDYRLKIYGTRDYLARRGVPQSREGLLSHPFIGYIQDMIFAPGLDYLGDVHPKIRPSFQSSSIFAQLTATLEGLGLCILPIYIAARYPELVPVLGDEVDLRRHYWIACHHDLTQTPRVRTVMEFLRVTVGCNETIFMNGPIKTVP